MFHQPPKIHNFFEKLLRSMRCSIEFYFLCHPKRLYHIPMKVDKELLRRLKAGEEEAFEKLYWAYNARVYHFIHSMLKDDFLAEDLTQNVFLKIWEKHREIDPEQGINAYLFTIARHLAYKEATIRLRTDHDLEGLDMSDEGNAENRYDADSLRTYIYSLVEQLPEARRRIFCLSRFEQLSNREIAQRLGISEKTVETQLYRSLQYLRKILTSDKIIILALMFLIRVH